MGAAAPNPGRGAPDASFGIERSISRTESVLQGRIPVLPAPSSGGPPGQGRQGVTQSIVRDPGAEILPLAVDPAGDLVDSLREVGPGRSEIGPQVAYGADEQRRHGHQHAGIRQAGTESWR